MPSKSCTSLESDKSILLFCPPHVNPYLHIDSAINYIAITFQTDASFIMQMHAMLTF